MKTSRIKLSQAKAGEKVSISFNLSYFEAEVVEVGQHKTTLKGVKTGNKFTLDNNKEVEVNISFDQREDISAPIEVKAQIQKADTNLKDGLNSGKYQHHTNITMGLYRAAEAYNRMNGYIQELKNQLARSIEFQENLK